jgi:hypothetical protein
MKGPFNSACAGFGRLAYVPDIVGPHGGGRQVTRSRSRLRPPSRPHPDRAACVLVPGAITLNRVTTQTPASRHAGHTFSGLRGATLMPSLAHEITLTGPGSTSGNYASASQSVTTGGGAAHHPASRCAEPLGKPDG